MDMKAKCIEIKNMVWTHRFLAFEVFVIAYFLTLFARCICAIELD